jgi:hypothetical protein
MLGLMFSLAIMDTLFVSVLVYHSLQLGVKDLIT